MKQKEQRTLDGIMYNQMSEKFAEGVEKITGRPCPELVESCCGESSRGILSDLSDLLKYLAEDTDGAMTDLHTTRGVAEYLNSIFISSEIDVYYKNKRNGEESRFTTLLESISAAKLKDEHGYSLILKGSKSNFNYPVPIRSQYIGKYYFQLIIDSETMEPEALEFVINYYSRFELVLRRTAKKKSKG